MRFGTHAALASARRVVHVALFEIGRQVRQPLFWVAGALFFAFALMLMSTHGILGSAVTARNAPPELSKAVVVLSVFYLAVVVAMAGDAALRDARSGFEPILRATPVRRIEHLLGRWIGAQVAANLAFLIGLSGLIAGVFAPWTDKAAVGAFDVAQTLLVVIVVAVPTVAALTSLCFALAAGLRSVTAVYVTVIVLWVLALRAVSLSQQLHGGGFTAVSLVEPFGLIALRADLGDQDPALRAAAAVRWGGYLVGNRLAWAALSTGLVGLALLFERIDDIARLRRSPAAVSALAAPMAWPRVAPRFDAGAWLVQFRARLAWELRMLLRSPSLLILIALSAMLSLWSLWSAGEINQVPALPATRILAADLGKWFTLMGLIVCTFYAGELVWRDRDLQAGEMIDVSPVPDACLMAAKVLAMGVVLLLLGATGVVSAFAVQAAKGYFDGRPDLYLSMMVLPIGGALMVMVAGSVAAAALSPNRYVAWGVTGVVIGVAFVTSSYGVDHPLLVFLAGPSNSLSEMNTAGDGTHAGDWINLYWSLWMGIALLAAWLVWPRGRPAPWRARRDQAARRLRGPGGWVAAGLAAALLAVGGFVFLNINVWNDYTTKRQAEAQAADWERAVRPYVGLPEPTIVAVNLRVDIRPRRPSLVADGTYVIENRTGQTLRTIHVDMPGGLDRSTLDVEGATQTSNPYGLAVLRLDRPMAPGDRRRLRFRSEITPRGFGDDGGQTAIVENGTFLQSWLFAPSLGARTRGFLTDADARRRQGLPADRIEFEPSDPRATRLNEVHADWATSDITVVTDADQTPIAPGRLVASGVAGGRRTARFVSDQPILTAFSIQSARYAVRRAQHGKVAIAIYYHPGHQANVERMIKAVEGGLDVYQAQFGPYQFDYLRIVEFPAYGDYAQSFAGTIPFSENIGFVADMRDSGRFDYVTNVTLHELAHQWWAHQVIGADAKGARLLSEGLAEYSAFMAQSRLQGPAMANKGLWNEFRLYRQGVAERTGPEQSLARVTDQNFVAYYRSALTLETVRDLMGEAALHDALREFLAAHRFKGAPYATSEDLMATLRRHCSPATWGRVERLFRGDGPLPVTFYGGLDEAVAAIKAQAPDAKVTAGKSSDAKPSVAGTGSRATAATKGPR